MTQDQTARYKYHTSESYYHFVRYEIAPLLPHNPHNILEVGAASGATLRWLKSKFSNATTTGLELNEAMLPELRENVDYAIIGSIDDYISQLKSYDLILCLDVLEHLVDPWSVLRRLCSILNPDGSVIVSLPNVAHLSVSLPLLLRREFQYQDAGFLDRTHMRFFTEQSAVQLLNDAGLIVTNGLMAGLHGPLSKIIDRVSFGFLRHHLTKRYIMCGRKACNSHKQTPVRWTLSP
jgi:2-polyprenyl-3-methyl-5-hydroxy-6-metoxy-1,4-benzoquinol methylase